MLIPEAAFNVPWEADGRRGESEHQVYFRPETQTWMKRNTLNFHDGSISANLERVALQAAFFPNLKTEFRGFTDYQGELLPAIEQDDAQGVGPTDAEIAEWLRNTRDFVEVFETGRGMRMAHGLAVQAGLKPPPLGSPRRAGFYNRETGTWLEDVHSENAVMAPNGEILVFDPVMYLVGNIEGG